MLMNDKQKQFVHLRIAEGKSFQTISQELDVPVHILKEWTVTLMDYLEEKRIAEFDQIADENQVYPVPHFKYLAGLYSRLKNELDKRDFSGLPTDKLYYIFNHTHMELRHLLNEELDEPWDEYDNFDDFPEDEFE